MTWILAGCVHTLEPSMVPDEVVTVTTDDGWRNQLLHYPGDGPPVLLVHGMGANHYNFDFREEVSVAAALQAQGWDVWIPELRGDPGSQPPDRRGARRSITFDAFAELDLPAAVDEVLARTDRETLYWVGHSMGGMLLYATLADSPERIAAGVTICSPSTFEAVEVPFYLGAARITLGGPGRVRARALARLTHPIGRVNPLFGRVANRANLDWPMANGLAKHALNDISKPLARQALGWVSARSLDRLDGSPWVVPAAVPLLVLGAPLDKIVSVEDVRATCDVFPDCAYRELSVAEGFSADFGHVDPVVGRTAREEVYPLVTEFLGSYRAAEAFAVLAVQGSAPSDGSRVWASRSGARACGTP
jgi:polyhydroxyalkanoate synthase subunit PhaC